MKKVLAGGGDGAGAWRDLLACLSREWIVATALRACTRYYTEHALLSYACGTTRAHTFFTLVCSRALKCTGNAHGAAIHEATGETPARTDGVIILHVLRRPPTERVGVDFCDIGLTYLGSVYTTVNVTTAVVQTSILLSYWTP